MPNNCSSRTDYYDLEDSPAAVAIAFEKKYFTFPEVDLGLKPNKYFGVPSADLTQAWQNLTRYQNIAVPVSLMEQLGRTGTFDGVKLPDGSGYLGTINVYHSLHCHEQVHRWMYREIYFPGIEGRELQAMLGHVEHCLEGLREYVTCKADMSLITYRWDTIQSMPLANWTFPHVCQKWDDLEEWAQQLQVEKLSEKEWLMHPTLGWAYSDANRVGAVISGDKNMTVSVIQDLS